MALTQNFKINQISKDLGIKSKDVMELLSAHGVAAKTAQSTLEPDEFGVLLNVLTKENQISGIEDYLDGITYIPSGKKAVDAGKTKEKEAVSDSKAREESAEKAEKAEKPETTSRAFLFLY